MKWFEFLHELEIELPDDPTAEDLRNVVLDKVDYFKTAQIVAACPDLMHWEPQSTEHPFPTTTAANVIRNLIFDAIRLRQGIAAD